MPAFATHYIFLKEMAPVIKEESDFSFDEEAAGIGTQGPDIFLFHRLWPPFTIYKALMGTASALHKSRAGELFDAFAEYLTFAPNKDVAKSYIYGFILHYALDRNCHPYVYAFQNQITAENKKIHPLAAHNVVEHSMDSYLLDKHLGIYPPSEFDPASTFSSDDFVLDEIAHLLHFVISKCLESEVSEKEIKRAIRDTAKLQDTLADRKGGATRLAHFLEVPLGPITHYFKLSASIKPKDLEKAKKYANINNEVWISPYAEGERKESFEELFERSKLDAAKLLDGFEAVCKGELSGYEVTNNISFLTGLEVK